MKHDKEDKRIEKQMKKLLSKVEKVNQEILNNGWIYFGVDNHDFECNAILPEYIETYLKERKLPEICDNCYKGLLFLDDFSPITILNLLSLIDDLSKEFHGKFNNSVVVVYFSNLEQLNAFLKRVNHDIKNYHLSAKVQWRKACKYYQDLKPDWWKNAKEFSPDYQTKQLTNYVR